MPSSYPSRGNTSGTLCSQCGMMLSRNLSCTNCGYSNASMQATISEQETQPSPVFPALPEDPTSQPTLKLERYDKQPQNLSSHPSQRATSSVQSTSSATPFLGINPDVPFSFSQQTESSRQSVPSVTPFLGMIQQPALPQIDFKQSSSNESFPPLSSYSTQPTLIIPVESPTYSTQPTLIIPVESPKRQKRPSGDSNLKQTSRNRSKKRNLLSGIIILIVVLVIGGLASYLFMYLPMIQKSTWIVATPSSVRPKEPSEFVDAFKNNRNQWDLRSDAGKYSVAIANGNLVLEDNSNSLLPELLPGNRSFTNFRMGVDAVLSKGDQKNGYGLYIRCLSDQNGNPSTYYRFELYGDSTYAIFKGILDKHGRINPNPLTLVKYTMNAAIRKQGDSNHIEVSAKGSTIMIRVNGQELKTFADPSYTQGTIALFISNVQNTSPGAQAKFSNLVIYPL